MQSQNLDVAQLVAHLVRDQEVEGSSPFIQTIRNQALTSFRECLVWFYAGEGPGAPFSVAGVHIVSLVGSLSKPGLNKG